MTQSGWTALHVRTNDRARMLQTLFALGAKGVQEVDGRLVTHLRSVDPDRAWTAVAAADARADVEFASTPEVDWTTAWREHVTPHRAGPFVVTPPWRADEFAPAERIVIEPGMAFGTGDHETTRGVLRLLADQVRAGDLVADLGAGSGVLGIAAAKRGARHVFCIESDPDALSNAEDNVRRNGVAAAVSVLHGDAAALLPLVAPVQVVLANIVTAVLLELLPCIGEALAAGGRALLSGVLRDESGRVCEALGRGAWRVLATDPEGAWWSVAIARS